MERALKERQQGKQEALYPSPGQKRNGCYRGDDIRVPSDLREPMAWLEGTETLGQEVLGADYKIQSESTPQLISPSPCPRPILTQRARRTSLLSLFLSSPS
jgi:hypothetical protein